MEAASAFTGEKVEASDLKNVLGNMGIEITEEEQLMLSKTLPISRKTCQCQESECYCKEHGDSA